LRQTECPAKRPEPNPDDSVTTSDRQHPQQKRKRPQEPGKTKNEPTGQPAKLNHTPAT